MNLFTLQYGFIIILNEKDGSTLMLLLKHTNDFNKPHSGLLKSQYDVIFCL